MWGEEMKEEVTVPEVLPLRSFLTLEKPIHVPEGQMKTSDQLLLLSQHWSVMVTEFRQGSPTTTSLRPEGIIKHMS